MARRRAEEAHCARLGLDPKTVRRYITVAEAIALSAIERKESRGGHFREDYPDKVEEFSTINIMVQQSGQSMRVSRVPIPPIPAELKQVIEEQKS